MGIEFKWKNPVNPKESTYAFKQREVDADFWLLMYTKDFKKTYKATCKCDWNLWRDEDDDDEEKPGMGDFGMGGIGGMGGMGGGPTYESDDDSDSDDDDIPELEGADDDAKKTEVKTEKKTEAAPAADKKEATPAPKESCCKAEDSLPPLEE